MPKTTPWQPLDIAWAERQAAEQNRLFQRYGITSPYGLITPGMVLDVEESYRASIGISLDESRTTRERMMADAKRPAARLAAILRECITGKPGQTTAAPVAPWTSEDGAVATASEIGGESREAEIPPKVRWPQQAQVNQQAQHAVAASGTSEMKAEQER